MEDADGDARAEDRFQHDAIDQVGLSHIMTETAKEDTIGTRRAARNDDWAQYKPLILRLYVDENRTLHDVMQRLAREHDFKASERKFKRKITEWNLSKNLKTAEMQCIASLARERHDMGKPTVFKVRGQVVDQVKIERFLKRNPNVDISIRQKTPDDIEYFTPEEQDDGDCVPTIEDSGHRSDLSRSPSTSKAQDYTPLPLHATHSNSQLHNSAVKSGDTRKNSVAEPPGLSQLSPIPPLAQEPLDQHRHLSGLGESSKHKRSDQPVCLAESGVLCFCNSCRQREQNIGLPERNLELASLTAGTTSINEYALALPIASASTLAPETFVKVQNILKVTLKDQISLSETQKESLAKFLDISPAQLDYCVEVKLGLEPTMNKLLSEVHQRGVHPDHVTKWFHHMLLVEPVKNLTFPLTNLPRGYEVEPTIVSTYHPLKLSRDSNFKPPNKRRRKDDSREKKIFQCTFVGEGEKPCLKTLPTITDWRRHEETHWPQRRWECLLKGTYPDITCHVCGESIDTETGDYFLRHNACLGREPRRIHHYSRKDKLVSHMRSDHGIEIIPNVQGCCYPVSSNWDRTCGFCGFHFPDWDARIHHIAGHFGDGKSMSDWRIPETIEEGNDENDKDPDGDDAEIENDEIPPSQPLPYSQVPSDLPTSSSVPKSQHEHKSSEKRYHYEEMWDCCHCGLHGAGPLAQWKSFCSLCTHRRCRQCLTSKIKIYDHR